MAKYEFTGETRPYDSNHRVLHRIRRLSDGLVGGWIESEYNLSQDDECFVYDQAIVCGNAQVFDSAQFLETATATSGSFHDNVRVGLNANIRAQVCFTENCQVRGVWVHAPIAVTNDVIIKRPLDFWYLELQGLGLSWTISDHLRIGCQSMPVEEWLAKSDDWLRWKAAHHGHGYLVDCIPMIKNLLEFTRRRAGVI